jgi:hypothetical protein
MNILYPKTKSFFQNYINIFKEIYNKEPTIIKSLIYYKNIGYQIINNILFHNKFPLIYIYGRNNSSLKKRTIINTEPLYVFPKDLESIKNYKKKELLNHINNIDHLFFNYNFNLDECILFRGYKTSDKKKTNISTLTGENYLFQSYKNFFLNKNKDVVLNNYNSFSLNPQVCLRFIRENGYLLVLKVHKKDNVPGIFISNVLFNEEPKFNDYTKKQYEEMEILLPRKLRINILTKKEVKTYNNNSDKSINEIYNKKKNSFNKIKIIYAETCSYTKPEVFTPDTDSFSYICS